MSDDNIYQSLKDDIYFDKQFYIIPNEVLNNDNLNNDSKIIFPLMQEFEVSGKIKFKNKSMKRKSGLCITAISNSITQLQNEGYIKREGGRNNRVLYYYKEINDIFNDKKYARIPSAILKHRELNSKDKILYTILLSLQFYKLIERGFDKNKPRTWFTLNVTRQRLAERMDCSVDTITRTLIKLNETTFNNRPLIYNSNENFWKRKDFYSCNVMCPTNKEEFEQLTEDEEIEFKNPYA